MAGWLKLLAVCFLALAGMPFGALAKSISNAAGLLNASFINGGAKIDLLTVDHYSSRFSSRPPSRSERALSAVQRSRQRHDQLLGRNQFSGSGNGNNNTYVSPRVYPSNGTYTLEFNIGTPARTFVLIVDTGSDLLWLTCQDCDDCNTTADPLFNPQASSTYAPVSCTDPKCVPTLDDYECPANGSSTCSFAQIYGDYSSETSGTFSKETITLTSIDGTPSPFAGFYFGCATDEEGNFGQTDGIMGLGRGDLSLVTQLGPYINHTFSYCLVDFDSSISKASKLTFGTISGSKPPLTYTPLLTNIYTSFYHVSITGISVAGEMIKYPEGTFSLDDASEFGGYAGTILDTGTTLTFLAEAAYRPFLVKIQTLISYPLAFSTLLGYDLCYNISGIPHPTYPQVVFHLQDVNITLPDQNVFFVVDDAGETSCLAFESSFGLSILGNIWQQNFYLEFDTVKNRLGIAPTGC